MKMRLGLAQREDTIDGSHGRQRIVQTAASHFAKAGLRGTSGSMLANAAGIPEGTLYAHFGTKERLFREAVRNNIDTRLGLLEQRLRSVRFESETAALERIAEATVTVCVDGAGNSILMSWALLEDHEYAADLYRN